MFGKDLKTYAKALRHTSERCFSSQGSGDKRHPHAIVLLDENSDGTVHSFKLLINGEMVLQQIYLEVTVWPDPSLGLLGPKDLRMPLPGNVGFSHRLVSPTQAATVQSQKSGWHETDIFSCLTNYERQIQAVKQTNQDSVDDLNSEEIQELLLDLPQPSDVLECVAQDCPKLVRKG